MNATTEQPTMQPMEPLDTSWRGLVPRDEEGRLNPFHWDSYHMGMSFSRNVLIMIANHAIEKGKYMILVNRTTGERVKIEFPENWQ